MDRLPSELVDYLFGFLSPESSKTLRLLCKSFAEIGESHLFNNFEFRLYPQLSRLSQLKQLSLHPTIAPRLRCLCYESGIELESGDYSNWRARIHHSEMNSPSRGVTSDGKAQKADQHFHELQNPLYTPDQYEQYRRWLDHQAGIMAHSPKVASTFASTLSKCYSVNSIKIVMAGPEITLNDLARHVSGSHEYIATNDLQPAIRIEQRRRNCLTHFMSLLKAVYSSGRIISELIALDLPTAMLKGTKYEADIISGVFSPLQHLDLKIGDFPKSHLLPRYGNINYFRGRDVAAMTLRKTLNEPKELRRLSLTFPPGRESEFSFDIFDQTNLDQLPRRWLLGLKQLSLSNFLVSLPALQDLLNEARDLKSLALCEATMESGSMIELLTYLRGLKLDHVCIGGGWVVGEDGGHWHCHDQANFFNCCEEHEGPYAVNGLRSKIESYIIDGGTCPLPRWTSDGEEVKTWEVEGDTSWHYMPVQIDWLLG
jgi:hypothetical protein